MKENIQGVTSFHELFTTKYVLNFLILKKDKYVPFVTIILRNPGMLWWFSCFWIAYHGVYNNAMEYAYKLGFNYNHKRVAHGNDNLQTVFAEEILPITINYMKKLYIAPSKNNKNNANYQENVDKFCVVMENFLLEGVGVGYHFMDLTGDVNENSAERFVTNSVRSSIPLQIAYSSKSMVPFHERTTPTQQPKRMGGKRSSKS